MQRPAKPCTPVRFRPRPPSRPDAAYDGSVSRPPPLALLAALGVLLGAGCATEPRRHDVVTVATPETAAQLRDNAREEQRMRRWIAKKRLCRDHAVRFDSSARCW